MPLGYAVAVWQSPDATTLCYRWLTVECGSIDLSDYFQEQKLCLSPKEILIILFRTFVVILSQSHLERERESVCVMGICLDHIVVFFYIRVSDI